MRPGSGTGRTFLASVLIAAAAATLYAPAVSFQLIGDDYQLLQTAKVASHRPSALLSADGVFRPLAIATLMADRTVWHARSGGYHLTNLVLHIVAGIALLLVGLRLRLGLLPSVAVSMMWSLSPMAAESTVWVSARPDTMLAICWFLIITIWPRPDRAFTVGRTIAIATLVGGAVLTKESWVATPILFLGLGIRGGRTSLRRTVTAAAATAVAAIGYLAVRVITNSTLPGSIEVSGHTLAKVCHTLAAFWFLEELQPIGYTMSWRGVLAVAATGALVASAFRARDRCGLVGATLILAALLPTLPISYLPHRYLLAANAGFLLLVTSWVVRATAAVEARYRRLGVAAAGVVVVLVVSAEVTLVRADLSDWARVSSAHGLLLRQARSIVPDLPEDGVVGIVRLDAHNPLAEIASQPNGGWKLLWARHSDPSGLIDAAALLEWVIDRDDTIVRTVAIPAAGKTSGSAVGQAQDGFTWLCRPCPDLGEVLARFLSGGYRLRAVRISHLDGVDRQGP